MDKTDIKPKRKEADMDKTDIKPNRKEADDFKKEMEMKEAY